MSLLTYVPLHGRTSYKYRQHNVLQTYDASQCSLLMRNDMITRPASSGE